jgi:hypothetical protein
MPKNPSHIIKALWEGSAKAISDGSYKEGYGTAAIIVVGDLGQRIQDQVVAPGSTEDQSSFRSELTGIYTTITFVKALCEYYVITQGPLEFACNGLSALTQVFGHSIITTKDPGYDIILAARKARSKSPVIWKTRHILGHQDDNKNHTLTEWELPNIEVDKLAKQFLETARATPQHYSIGLEPWSLWYQGKKILAPVATIYDIVHAQEAKSYWLSRIKCPREYWIM